MSSSSEDSLAEELVRLRVLMDYYASTIGSGWSRVVEGGPLGGVWKSIVVLVKIH